MTEDDLRERAYQTVRAEKLRAAVLRERSAVTKPQTAWAQWQAEAIREWRPKIECHDGYVLAELCGNRAATALPGSVSPGSATTAAARPRGPA